MTRTALVTGAAGFIGRQLVTDLVREGWIVDGLDRNVPVGIGIESGARFHRLALGGDSLDALIRERAPNVCFHAAGVASVPRSFEAPDVDFSSGVGATFALLDALRRNAPACRVVFLSSAAVYGNPEVLPVAESARVAPVSPYGWHKLISELLCREHAGLYGMPIVIARIFSAYGEGLRRQVLWDVCRKLSAGEVATFDGSPNAARDFLHVSDVSRALLTLAESGVADGRCYNVGSGIETRIEELVNGVREALGDGAASATFSNVVSPGTPIRWRADTSALESLGFSARVGVAAGVHAYVRWWLDLEPEARRA